MAGQDKIIDNIISDDGNCRSVERPHATEEEPRTFQNTNSIYEE